MPEIKQPAQPDAEGSEGNKLDIPDGMTTVEQTIGGVTVVDTEDGGIFMWDSEGRGGRLNGGH